jgi:hypothetical protein
MGLHCALPQFESSGPLGIAAFNSFALLDSVNFEAKFSFGAKIAGM